MNTTPNSTAGQGLACLLTGAVFGLGLSLAQMIDPRVVLGFLDIAGDWNPSLMFVLGGAVVVAFAGFRLVQRRAAPLFAPRFLIGATAGIDRPLVAGAVLFGIGWGIGGYCPGPAIASLGFANSEALWFLPAMFAGAGLQRWQSRQRPARPSAMAAGDG